MLQTYTTTIIINVTNIYNNNNNFTELKKNKEKNKMKNMMKTLLPKIASAFQRGLPFA